MNERFEREYLCNFSPTEHEQKMHELADRYHLETERYDRSVCTGPIINGSVRPATNGEAVLINRNAVRVRNMILYEAEFFGIDRKEMSKAISNHKSISG